MSSAIIVSCEHAGNLIPAPYTYLFKDKDELLRSHRGWDTGALELAERISTALHCPFFFEKVSRLVVDQNRSHCSMQLFSEITGKLSPEQKECILDEIYNPYHTAIFSQIENLLEAGKMVYHFSIHSFTPVFQGVIRNADIGLLYDPKRKIERKLCLELEKKLHNEVQGIRIRHNYPYKGTSDGLTTALRKNIGVDSYAGIEIEMSQLHIINKTEIWSDILSKIAAFISEAVTKCSGF